jgi:hypothetical protein
MERVAIAVRRIASFFKRQLEIIRSRRALQPYKAQTIGALVDVQAWMHYAGVVSFALSHR